jgi:shikimate dehydrogenase
MFNTAFKVNNLDFAYIAMNVKKNQLAWAMKGMKALNLHGLNVTIPHKINVVRHLDWIDPEAIMIGAVNTILNDDGELKGYNTDGIGAARAIEESGTKLEGKTAVLIGSGGAARAIAFALSDRVERLTILNRHVDKARRLSADLTRKKRGKVYCGSLEERVLKLSLSEADLIVHATSVGMHPHDNISLLNGSFLSPDQVVFDIVYNPLETKLLREATTVGAKTVDGLGMLVYQAAETFKIWTGINAPIEMMRKIGSEELLRLSGR